MCSVDILIVFWASLSSKEPNRDFGLGVLLKPSSLGYPTWHTVWYGVFIVSSDELECDLESIRHVLVAGRA